MAGVMRLKSYSSQEIVQNGNNRNVLGSLVDGNKNDQERISNLEDTVKWVPTWAEENQTNNKLDSPTTPSTPQAEEDLCSSRESSSCSGSDSEEELRPPPRPSSFSNPNYPGFSHLAHELAFDSNNNNSDSASPTADEEDSKRIDWVNRIEGCQVKEIYKRSKLDLGELEENNMAVRASGKKEKTEINNSLRRGNTKDSGDFDVYNIETAMPKIDLEAIESHLRAAREEERRRRNDREEIRRRLATGDNEDYYGGDKPGKKPSLQARLQSGMNLQICFMNETSSDTESPSSESAPPASLSATPTKTNYTPPEPPRSLNLPNSGRTRNINSTGGSNPGTLKMGLLAADTGDFFTRQARLQTEARLALAQAKERARLQMEAERHRTQISPITQMLRDSLHKVGIKFPEDRRRLSRQMLTDMNVAQLQVIVNDLHSQIEILNESLVKFLMERDELHMSQDSMLVDIEDITRYLVPSRTVSRRTLPRTTMSLDRNPASSPISGRSSQG